MNRLITKLNGAMLGLALFTVAGMTITSASQSLPTVSACNLSTQGCFEN